MTPEAAAWVYQHVILGYHDANDRNWWCDPDQSDDRLVCACQLPCTWCRDGRHDICASTKARQETAAVRVEDGETAPAARQWRLGSGPETFLHAPAKWRPPTRKRPLWLPVWLADRVCRYLCTCTVCKAPAPPAPIQSAPAPSVGPAVPAVSEQLGLFEAVTR